MENEVELQGPLVIFVLYVDLFTKMRGENVASPWSYCDAVSSFFKSCLSIPDLLEILLDHILRDDHLLLALNQRVDVLPVVLVHGVQDLAGDQLFFLYSFFITHFLYSLVLNDIFIHIFVYNIFYTVPFYAVFLYTTFYTYFCCNCLFIIKIMYLVNLSYVKMFL